MTLLTLGAKRVTSPLCDVWVRTQGLVLKVEIWIWGQKHHFLRRDQAALPMCELCVCVCVCRGDAMSARVGVHVYMLQGDVGREGAGFSLSLYRCKGVFSGKTAFLNHGRESGFSWTSCHLE